jgi:hypothetical protein
MHWNVCVRGLMALLFVLAPLSHAQSRAVEVSDTATATASPLLRVTTKNPKEINIGKPATFVICVANTGALPATDILIATDVPEHVKVAKSDPKPLTIEGRIHKFMVGDLGPKETRCVTLVGVPTTTKPIAMNSTVHFATATRSLVVVRRPQLKLTAEVPPQAEIGTEVDWVIRVTNTGDGPAEDIVVTPSLVDGVVQGKPLQQAVKIGPLKPGETKEVQFTVIPTQRGKVTARFAGSNPDGLKASQESTFRALQAELAVQMAGPRVRPMASEGEYEISVSNPGDARTDSTLVTVTVPAGLEVTEATKDAYHEETRTLRWRITGIRPSGSVRLQFRTETAAEGEQALSVVASSEKIGAVTASHTTTVISRPNPVVTVMNDQEFAAVGSQIGFKVMVVNAGSKLADDLRIRVAIPAGLEAVDLEDYKVTGDEIEFPVQKLASGEKATLVFQLIGRQVGEHRVRVLVGGAALTNELLFEAAAFCYSDSQVPTERTAENQPSRPAAPSAAELTR